MTRLNSDWLLLSLALVCHNPAAAGSYTRFIEAEDFQLVGLQNGINRSAGYRGQRYVYRILKQVPHPPLRMSKRLERDLAPGVYHVFLRPHREGAAGSRIIRVTLNGATGETTFPTDDKTANRVWTMVAVRTQQPGRDLQIDIALQEAGRIIIDTVLLTDDMHWVLDKQRRLVHETTETREFPSRTGRNTVLNASFELGVGGWHTGSQCGQALTAENIVTQRPAHGRRCLQVELMREMRSKERFTNGRLEAFPQPVTAGEHTLSAYVRSAAPVQASLVAVLTDAAGQRLWRGVAQATLSPNSDWLRLAGKVQVPAGVTACRPTITFSHDAPATAWVDAVQFQSGLLTDFAPAADIETGALCPRLGRLFYADEPVSWNWTAWFERPESTTEIEYSVYDYRNRVIDQGNVSMESTTRGAVSKRWQKRVPPGVYHVIFAQKNGPAQQFSVCVARRPAIEDASIGTYLTLRPQPLEIMNRLGLRWMCTLSPAEQIASWAYVQPNSRDEFVFYDEDVQWAKQHHVRILGNINTVSYRMPKWALLDTPIASEPCIFHGGRGTKKYFRLSDWEHFVYNLVDHYKGTIRHWLVIDEPWYQYSAQDYGRLLQTTHRAAKRADPNCLIFTHGGYSDTFLPQVIEAVGTDCFDGVYDYQRRRKHTDLLSDICLRHGKRLWAVEYGGVRTLYAPPGEVKLDSPPDRASVFENMNRSLHSAIRSLCWGPAEKYFRYDARFPGYEPPLDYMTLWEYDGAIKPLGAGLANLNRLVAGMRGDDECRVHPQLHCFLFQRGEQRLAALWSASGEWLRLALPPALSSAKMVDVMGAPVARTPDADRWTVVIDMLPTYLQTRARSREELVRQLADIHIEPALPVDLSIAPETPAQPLLLRAEVTNRTGSSVELTCALSRSSRYALRDEQMADIDLTRIPPGAAATAEFPLNWYPGDRVEDKPLQVNFSGPGLVFWRRKIIYYVPVQKRTDIQCDGDLSEWDVESREHPDPGLHLVGFRPRRPDSARQAQIRAWLRWEEKGLLVAVRTSDRDFRLPDPTTKPIADSGQVLRLYLASVDSPHRVASWTLVPDEEGLASAPADEAPPATAAARWRAGRWYAEALLPFAALGPFQAKSGSSLLFDLEFVDWDADRPLGEIVWSCRETTSGDPRGFGQVVLR